MRIEDAALNIGRIDALGYGESPIHRIDPRVKIVVALAVIVAVVSFPKYEVAGLIPFFIFPVLAAVLGNIPWDLVATRLLLASPFAVGVGILNPVFDRTPLLFLGDIPLAGGWVSFASILLRFVLTVGTAILLVATTSMPRIGEALSRLGLPRGFVVQILMLYRYIFVLIDEGIRIVRARNIRSTGRRGRGIHVFRHLISALFFRTSARAERIHTAMLSRGFDGVIRTTGRRSFRAVDAGVLVGGIGTAVFFRLVPVARLIGSAAVGADLP